MSSGTLWYQAETEEATDHTAISMEQHINAESIFNGAEISVTPIILVWEPSDLVSSTASATGLTSLQSPTIFTPRPTASTIDTSIPHRDSALSNGAVAAISVSAAMAAILLVAAFLFHRAWRRRRSHGTSQAEVNLGDTPSIPKPRGEVKAEMEDPVSARELFKQSGAYRGKPELGNEVDDIQRSNPGEPERMPPHSTQDLVVEESLPGERNGNALGHADPVELE